MKKFRPTISVSFSIRRDTWNQQFWASALCLFITVLSPATKAVGQQKGSEVPPNSTTYAITTRSILLDVVVLDKSGKQVRNLHQDDFSVLEDGVPQKIASFEPPDTRPMKRAIPSMVLSQSSLPTYADSGDAQPVSILILDQLNTTFEEASYGRSSVKEFLEKSGPALTQPTSLLVLSAAGIIKVIQDFTTDSRKLQLALNELPGALSPVQHGTSADRDAERFSASIAMLLDIAAATERYPGRKNVIWVGAGFRKLTNLPGMNNSARTEQIRRVSDRLMKSHVIFSYLDTQGLSVAEPLDIAMDREMSNLVGIPLQRAASLDFALGALALQTGGHVSFGENALSSAISSSVAYGGSYYRLSYYPLNHHWNGSFRRIAIRLHDSTLIAHTRAGYYAVDAKPSLSRTQLILKLTHAVYSPFAYRELRLAAFSTERLRNQGPVQFALAILPSDLEWHPISSDKEAFEVTILIASLSSKDSILEQATRDLEIGVDSVKLKVAPTNPILIKTEAPIPAGTAAIRIVVIDDHSGRIGTVEVAPDSVKASSKISN